MALVEYLKPLIMAAGFLCILAGLSIAITETPAYEGSLGTLYTIFLYTFYLYLAFLFISLLVSGLDALLKLRQRRS